MEGLVMASTPALPARLGAEFLGTFWLVLGGCGTAVLAATFTDVGVGMLGVALAFGLAMLSMSSAVGHISGAHFNPAVTLGLAVARRFSWRDVVPYAVVQVVAATAAGAVLLTVANGVEGFDARMSGFAANGFGDHSPGGYSMTAALVVEAVLTGFFLYVFLGATSVRAPAGVAPFAVGLALTLVHLVSLPVTNTSVNPARSTGVAFFAGPWAVEQLWLFWAAPLLGAVIAGATYTLITRDRQRPSEASEDEQEPPAATS
jgi:aquaporin Z